MQLTTEWCVVLRWFSDANKGDDSMVCSSTWTMPPTIYRRNSFDQKESVYLARKLEKSAEYPNPFRSTFCHHRWPMKLEQISFTFFVTRFFLPGFPFFGCIQSYFRNSNYLVMNVRWGTTGLQIRPKCPGTWISCEDLAGFGEEEGFPLFWLLDFNLPDNLQSAVHSAIISINWTRSSWP